MLVLSRKLSQEIVFPTIGVTIEVTRIRGATVCLGIEAPKDIPILRGELKASGIALKSASPTDRAPEDSFGDLKMSQVMSHELRNRINAMSLCLHVMKEYQDANLPIEARILSRALHELHTIEEIMACDNTPNPFVDQLNLQQNSPFVMLVDDAVNEAELLASYLRHVGIQVATSSDGNAALRLLECISRKPDVILLDMVMPGRDGQSTLSELRSNPSYNGIKVFAVSGLPADSLTKSSGLSVDRWFQKPIRPPQLVEQIRNDLAVPA